MNTETSGSVPKYLLGNFLRLQVSKNGDNPGADISLLISIEAFNDERQLLVFLESVGDILQFDFCSRLQPFLLGIWFRVRNCKS